MDIVSGGIAIQVAQKNAEEFASKVYVPDSSLELSGAIRAQIANAFFKGFLDGSSWEYTKQNCKTTTVEQAEEKPVLDLFL